MTLDQINSLPCRRYGRARVILTETQRITEPLVFVIDHEAIRRQWAEILRGRL